MGNTINGRSYLRRVVDGMEGNPKDGSKNRVSNENGKRRKFSELCREYEISRKTGYKWQERFLADGVEEMEEESRRPQSYAAKLGEEGSVQKAQKKERSDRRLEVNNNQPKQTMTKKKSKMSKVEIKSLMEEDGHFLKQIAQFIVQEVLEAEPVEGR